MKRLLSLLVVVFAGLSVPAPAVDPPPVLTLPPNLMTAGTVDTVNGQPWAYVVWNANSAEWLATRDIAVHLQTVPGGAFELQGVMGLLTDPGAVAPWITRAAALGVNLEECASIAAAMHSEWQNPVSPEPLPGALKDRLSALAVRAAQTTDAAEALYQLGNNHPLFRFVAGTGWAGPMNVANGQVVVIELRERDRATGAEGGVVGRLNLVAGAPAALAQPGAPVQVPPDFLQLLPLPGEQPLAVPPVPLQTDLGVALRWAIPEALRRQILLARGFHVWRLAPEFTPPGGLTGEALLAAETTHPGSVRRLTRSPLSVPKVFTEAGSGESGPVVDDFAADHETWFATDDNNRYATGANPSVVTGTPYAEGTASDYVAAAVDLLGRPGPVSARGSGVAVHTVPPPVPEVLRVENVMSGGGQRLQVVWKPNLPGAGTVSTTHYLVYRDRVKNTPPSPVALERSAHPAGHDDLIFIGAVAHPASPGDTLAFTDEALVPQAGDFGATYFYSIRAVHEGPLGFDISTPSPAVFGTLRDRSGPAAPDGYAGGDCPRVGIAFDDNGPTPEPLGRADVDPDQVVFRLEARRGTPAGAWRDVQWAFFWIINLDDPFDFTHISPLLHFGRGDLVWTEMALPLSGNGFTVNLIAANSTGRMSHIVSRFVYEVSGGHRYRVRARVLGAPTLAMATPGQPFDEYWTPYFDSGGSPTSQPVTPAASTPGTYRATFAGAAAATGRTLLVQREDAEGSWINASAPLLPAANNEFFFADPQLDPEPSWRVWEIIDPSGGPDPANCSHHARPADAAEVSPVQVVLLLPAGAREYRLYRKIDHGPLALLKQDAEAWDSSTVQAVMHADSLIPPAGGRIGYFGQAFDEHGNPSPLVLLGEKIAALPELPTPTLDPAVSGGTLAAPTMTVRAVCPSPGVQRIELGIDPPPGPSPPLVAETKLGSELFNTLPGDGAAEPVNFTTSWFTPLAPQQDPSVPVTLESTVNIQPATKYKVQARAVGADGLAGEWSAQQVFTWTPPVVAGTVAWPARPIPKPVNWNSQIQAFRMLDGHFVFNPYRWVDKYPPGQYPVGIRIGRIPLKSPTPNEYDSASNWDVRGARIPFGGFTLEIGYFGINNATGFPGLPPDPRMMHQFLAPRLKQLGDIIVPDFSQSLLPVVLYRRQIARSIEGVSLPTPDTDIIQASSMIEAISWAYDPPGTPDLALLIDPFVSAALLEPAVSPLAADLCLFDNSPVAAGATYQYYLVHFNRDYEPDAVIDAGTLNFPEAP
jgi:hypothetical protein